ncbi:MAG: anaerobic ribonucleoside-triphosphate reductase activating protein [Candidatus Methanoliparum thermophilum]|uniref:Anaerobic ribonucleoside-triphosphate reductase activating protein n=1 Tax=Methanoliparum thermophilum TaxID=2491083 RepID=A0A520KR99_METT2|nr:anaerobic ribonucleoside-triphosphate reductase activating protein [Candidatus Methanoliparum sp. LAM-1]RZN64143.1 MAG: anaerobic ribonucleoside-triphosphate reductase activating protein [Candidatus Methanoliparum thermophilum]BDC35589.1 hypothetical protein MTLP_02710 [Candidatus Methanoliparum sp. LAM-1]
MSVKINIAGIVPFSTVDLRDKTAIVFFLAGCPFRCIYCQNYEYLDYKNLVELDEIKSMIDRAKEFVEGVVVSGGEPTLQDKQLFNLLKYSKQKGLDTEIQTNGYRYGVIKKCLPYLDVISMDIKAPLRKETYSRICGIDEKVAETVIKSIKKIFDLVNETKLEVKTTIYKEFVNFLPDIKEDIPEGIDWIIQKGYVERIPPGNEEKITELREEEIKKVAEDLANDRRNVWIRTESGDNKI